MSQLWVATASITDAMLPRVTLKLFVIVFALAGCLKLLSDMIYPEDT
jgi:hypothetical protein